MRAGLLSFSVNNSGGFPSQYRNRSPSSPCEAASKTEPGPDSTSLMTGFDWPADHDQVLRNQSVGSTCRVAAWGPRLATLIWMRVSSGDSLAYSTNTSK